MQGCGVAGLSGIWKSAGDFFGYFFLKKVTLQTFLKSNRDTFRKNFIGVPPSNLLPWIPAFTGMTYTPAVRHYL